MRGLEFRALHIPFTGGLNTKADPRALAAPALSICKDVAFDEHGGLQTRYPYTGLAASFGEDIRGLAVNGDELLAFTKDALWSWDDGLGQWRSKGTHLAAKVDEVSRFVTTGDQINGDRAELGNTIVHVWEDSGSSYYATLDRITGAVTTTPTFLDSAQRPRLVALTTKILLFYIDAFGGATSLVVRSIDPTTLVLSAASSCSLTTSMKYDATRVLGADQAIFATSRNPTTSYRVGKVTAALVITTSDKARTCDGPIALAHSQDAGIIEVVRGNGVNVQGDAIVHATLADSSINHAIGSVPALMTLNQIACAFRSVAEANAEWRCYVFWDHNEATDGTDWSSYYNWVDTGANVGTAARFVRKLGIASRAFEHDGRVFAWGVFAGTSEASAVFGASQVGGQIQNTYFLYRDDAHLTAKAAATRAGGFASTIGHLPHVSRTVANANRYAWSGSERRIVELGERKKGYADRGPRDIWVEFDSNEARRCVRLGGTLYIAGGEIRQYDGVRISEVGFHVFPWYMVGNLVAGSIPAGTYFYKSTLRWENAAGEVDRSTTATQLEVKINPGPSKVQLITIPLHITHRTSTSNPPAVEWWRSKANVDGDSFLATKKNPASLSNPNRYLPNEPLSAQSSTVEDDLTDAQLGVSELYPEADGELENLSPPPASIITATADRVFLAGVAGDPDRVWYSKLREAGEVASFHENLAGPVPSTGGAITALAFLNETLVVFRERAIYLLPGDGFDNVGAGSTYGPARNVSLDVGAVSHEALGITPEGLIFKSSKGWHLLDKGWGVRYIGGPIADYDSETVTSVHVIESRHQIRVTTAARTLVFDYLVGQWAEWTVEATHAVMWRGVHVIASGGLASKESTSYTGIDYGLDIESAWIKPADLQGSVRVTRVQPLGEFRSAHALRVRIAYNYSDTYVDDKTWAVSPTVVGGPLQVKHGPKRQQCQAFKVRLTAVLGVGSEGSPPAGEALKLTGLGLEVGLLPGLFNRLPAAQRQ